MNKKLIASAMVAAGLFSVIGTVQARPGSYTSALDDANDLVALHALDELLVANVAVNTAKVNGSLVIESTRGDVSIVGNQGSLATDISVTVDVDTGGRRNDAESNITVDLAPVLEAKLAGNNQFSTAAFGAVNTGEVDITAAQMADVSAGRFEFEMEAERNTWRRSRFGSASEIEIEIEGAQGAAETLNPTVGVLNVAYNVADIDGSMEIKAAAGRHTSGDVGIANTDLSTTAFGALNQGTVAVAVTAATLPAVNLGR